MAKGNRDDAAPEEVHVIATIDLEKTSNHSTGRGRRVIIATCVLACIGVGLGVGLGLHFSQDGRTTPARSAGVKKDEASAMLPPPESVTAAQLRNMSAESRVWYTAYNDHDAINTKAVATFLSNASKFLPADTLQPEAAGYLTEFSNSLVIYMRSQNLDKALKALRQVAKGNDPFAEKGVLEALAGGNLTELEEQLKKAVDATALKRWLELPDDVHEAIMENATRLSHDEYKAATEAGLRELAAWELRNNFTIFGDSSEPDTFELFSHPFNMSDEPPPSPPASGRRRSLLSGTVGLRIPIVFHVFRYKDKAGRVLPPANWKGNTPFYRLINGMNKVHSVFRSGFQFYVAEIRTDIKRFPYLNLGTFARWQACTAQGPDCIDYISQRSVRDVRRFINIYTSGTRQKSGCSSCPFGYAYTPYEGSETDTLQSYVWMLWDRVDPAMENNARSFEAGLGTIVHETGHWLGLEHTHKGGCADQDGVADTPANMNGMNQPWYSTLNDMCVNMIKKQLKPTPSMLARFNSCPAKGLDNVFNYLSYNPAACRRLFTKGQIARMRALTYKFRPTLIKTANVGR